ncbi:MAG: hypothetical protein RL567_69 [Bacteroidota bacterium]|jgi:hypothetical protein
MRSIYLLIVFLLLSLQGFCQFTSGQNGVVDPANAGFPNPKTQQKGGQQTSNKSGRAALDDSTKQIYGPQTVHYFLESDAVNSDIIQRRIDTTLTLLHRYLYQERDAFLSTSLGNQGTAYRNIFTQASKVLGTQMGYQAYIPYAFQADQVRYYQTKSPYSDVTYNLGAGGQTNLNFAFARNVDSLWNVGVEVQRLVADKNLTDAAFKSGDLSLTGQWGVLLHTNLTSRNKRYRLLGHINYFDQGTNDQGGIRLTTGQTPADALKYIDNTALLTDSKSQSNDQFLKLHLYHEFIGFKGLQLFQQLDAETRKVKFRDLAFQTNLATGFYPRTYINYIQAPSSDSLYNENQWRSYSHKTGIKGIFRQFTYRAHIKQRYWSVYNPMNQSTQDKLENYAGLWLRQQVGKNLDFQAEGEYLIGSDYLLKASLSSPWFWASYQRTSVSPTLANQWVYNSSFRWNNDFKNIEFDQLAGGIALTTKHFYLKPAVTIQRIGSWVYFDSLSTATQAKEAIAVFRTSVSLGGNFGRFEWQSNVHANTQTGPDVMRMPSFLANANLALNVQYKKLLYMQFGIDVIGQSAYYGDTYQPAIQQYHLQNRYELPAFIQVDPYVSLRINRVRLFFKMSNATQGLLTDNYYAAYLYPAMSRGFAYGVKWLLFD